MNATTSKTEGNSKQKTKTASAERHAEAAEHRKKFAVRYFSNDMPRSVPAGRFIAHNFVPKTITTTNGVDGFRVWTQADAPKDPCLVKCACGWSGLPHYTNAARAKVQA